MIIFLVESASAWIFGSVIFWFFLNLLKKWVQLGIGYWASFRTEGSVRRVQMTSRSYLAISSFVLTLEAPRWEKQVSRGAYTICLNFLTLTWRLAMTKDVLQQHKGQRLFSTGLERTCLENWRFKKKSRDEK